MEEKTRRMEKSEAINKAAHPTKARPPREEEEIETC
jgi:hypothetical protein